MIVPLILGIIIGIVVAMIAGVLVLSHYLKDWGGCRPRLGCQRSEGR